MKFKCWALISFLFSLSLLLETSKCQLPPPGSCGPDAQGQLCQNGFCCSKWGFCGNTTAYCSQENCQSQCPSTPSTPPPPGSCGPDAQGQLCQNGFCCSKWGFCGNTPAYCSPENCQSQCPSTPSTPPPPTSPPPPSPPPPSPAGPTPPASGGDISSIITRSMFDEMLKYRDDSRCFAVGFYTYDAFIDAAKSFPEFGNTGDLETRKREIAAFFGQTSHETTGGWPSADDGPFFWGYCFVEEIFKGDYCQPSIQWPCIAGKQYFGRGPIQLSWNYNYGQCGEALGLNLLSNPELVASDPVISFKAALWFWMTPQPPKPSCHDVMTGKWTPSPADISSRRVPGYGLTTNIINGGLECAGANTAAVANRIGFYKRYCDDVFEVGYGENLDCADQIPYGFGLSLQTM